MTTPESTVCIIDDDQGVREAVEDLLSSFGFHVITFGSAAQYVASGQAGASACLLLDVNLPDINGFEFQRQLADGLHPPIVFITADVDIPSSLRAMKDGAVDVLVKPFSEEQLLSAINSAVQLAREAAGERVGRSGSSDDSPETKLR